VLPTSIIEEDWIVTNLSSPTCGLKVWTLRASALPVEKKVIRRRRGSTFFIFFLSLIARERNTPAISNINTTPGYLML
jgi:hypothetical protein